MEPIKHLEPVPASIDHEDDSTENALRAALGEPSLEALISEIRRYLAVVDVFRGEGCGPCWS